MSVVEGTEHSALPFRAQRLAAELSASAKNKIIKILAQDTRESIFVYLVIGKETMLSIYMIVIMQWL